MEMSIVRPSSSQWASPLHIVPKPSNGEWCPCGDYRWLNQVSIPNQYAVLHLQDFTATLAGSVVFSKITLIQGYHQIPVAQEDICMMMLSASFQSLAPSVSYASSWDWLISIIISFLMLHHQFITTTPAFSL